MSLPFRHRSRCALCDKTLQKNLSRTLPQVILSHDRSVREVENWEELRDYARQVKAHTMDHLDQYLLQFESRILENGGKVYWADDGAEAVDFILELAHKRDIEKLVKSKSMLGEEIQLNRALERARIEPVETDLGEYIVQLAGQTPSHIVAPALHLSREQVAHLFEEKLGMEATADVSRITAFARSILRKHFLSARLGITGVNFGIAETGAIVIVENEGNARLSISAPEIHVAIMGIEKVIPRLKDLPVFLKLLTRSATGQKISTYVNLVNGPARPGELDGPAEFYLVLIDNGRSKMLRNPLLRQTLFCIRCGACLTACPVYQHLGGHAYGSVYSGPIGAILAPQLEGLRAGGEKAYASSLCGACADTCPVKIEIAHILLELRHHYQEEREGRASHLSLERLGFQIWARLMTQPRLYSTLTRRFRPLLSAALRRRLCPPPLSRWLSGRDLPPMEGCSFRELLQNRRAQT